MKNQQNPFVQNKYAVARVNLLLMSILTVANVILFALGSDTYLLFSASIPMYLPILFVESLVTYAILGVILTLPYLALWFFSKKSRGCMIGALVLFSLDCIVMLYFAIGPYFADWIIDIVFHAWVMYYLIMGVVHGNEAGKEPEFVPLDTVLTPEAEAAPVAE